MERGSGVLLHVSSLPSQFGVGDLGPGAYRFAYFLHSSKQIFWQILPISPTDQATNNSPYSSFSAFAASPLFISPEILVEEGYLQKDDICSVPEFDESFCQYSKVIPFKEDLLRKAYENFKQSGKNKDKYETFCFENMGWLEDYALFVVIKRSQGGKMWCDWPVELRDRNPESLNRIKDELSDEINREKFIQYLFFDQWFALKSYCNEKGIEIIGDIPIYVNYDSVDVWANHRIFKLDDNKRPVLVAGVPPDYFSKTGQLWGNPVYNWDVLKDEEYEWWISRIEHNLNIFDIVRIDHFRGFVDFWEVPYGEETAINGKWENAPARDFFNKLNDSFSDLPIIAEDLGIITEEVKNVMNDFEFPGMKILLFAFGEDLKKHPYLPHNYIENCVAYTGTHDNNTVRGWFENEAGELEKMNMFEYFGKQINADEISMEMIKMVMGSIADIAIFPMQDILGLGQESRMNLPGVKKGNWQWRLSSGQITIPLQEKLAEMTSISERD